MIAAAQGARPQRVRHRPPGTFKANAIEWLDGRWAGGADPRSEGAALANEAGDLARQLERFDNLVSLFLTRAAEKGDQPFLWAKRDKRMAARSAGPRRRGRWPRSRHRCKAIGLQPGDRVASSARTGRNG